MRTILYCFVAALVLLLTMSPTADAQLKGKISVVGVSDRFKAGNGNEPTYGIANVGIHHRITMKPFVVKNSSATAIIGDRNDSLVTATSASWTVTGPAGTTVTGTTDTALAGNSGLVVYFKPDVPGPYTVTMTAVTALGNVNATLTVTAADWKGIGVRSTAAGNTYGYAPFNCAPCHNPGGALSTIFDEFSKTNHANVIPQKLNQAGGHFADYCMRCHAVGFNTGAANGGYDDYATKLGFSIPSNGPGVYDSLLNAINAMPTARKDSMLTMLGLTGIQCEQCHGPAGEHAKTGNPALMAKKHSSEVCAPCHFSSDRHPKGYSWEASAHSRSTASGATSPTYKNRNSCSGCHVGQGFVNEVINGNPPPANYADAQPIGCVSCHDPHSKKNPYQLRRASVADACTGCHTTRLSGFSGVHHSHQGQMVQGTESQPFTGDFSSSVQNVAGWELPGYRYENSQHANIEERCVTCHMAQTPTFDPTFQTQDTLLNKVGGHTFAVVWDAGTPGDPADDLLNDVGCRSCHGPVSKDFVRLSQNKIKALLDTLKTLLPLRSPTANPEPGNPQFPQTGTLTQIQKAAAYNWYFVNNDLSYGVHNHLYAKGLLESSIEQVKLGAGAASIVSIKDVPGDQGKRVQVVWNKFPAEAFAFNPVINYGVWREDPVIGTVKTTPKKSYTEMIQTGTVGEKYSVMGMVWTYVANVPATKLAMYSYLAETLKDSTSAGTSATNFYIAGYSKDNAVVYSSPILSGYSIDNIPPLRVVEFKVTVSASGAALSWKNNPEDKDVVKYLVYRGTTQSFTPGTPLAEVTATSYLDAAASSGTPYWYIIQGVDQAGNKGDLTSPMGTTSVEQLEGLPTTYALGQNYPNPFNPATTISFSLPQAGSVVLSVYTISGELVTTIAQGEFPAGNFRVTWNGTDNSGASVASGMYLYRIHSGSFQSVKKMVLLK